MSLFKQVFARGVNDELIRLNYARYPTKEAADEVADAVGDQMPVEPATEAVPAEVAADVATQLVDAANQLVEATGGGGAEEPMPPEYAAGAEEAAKMSSAADIDTRAGQQAEAVMLKAAALTKEALGSTIEGGDKGNTMTQAPAGETVMENKNRPQGTHVLGVGNTKHPVGQGNVGTEQVPAPTTDSSPGESPSGSNSVIEQSKLGGALRQIIQKVAAGMGSTIEGGDKGNTLPQAGAVTGEGKIEADRRPPGYAHMGVQAVGQTNFPVGAGVVGSEQAHPDQPGASPGGAAGSGGNTVVEWSGAAADGPKAASDNSAYLTLFRETTEKVAAHMPPAMDEEQKISHIRHMMGMNDVERSQYIGKLHKEAGATDDQAVEAAQKHAECAKHRKRYNNPYGHERRDRTKDNQKQAAEVPPALAANAAKVEAKAEKKDDDKKPPFEVSTKSEGDMKDKEGKKEGSLDLLSRIRLVAQQTLNT
jgi:hypothetical protein